jgi:hypothetical protein
MMVEKRNFKTAEDFSRACVARFIDHLQRRGLNEAESKKLRKIYVGNVGDLLSKKVRK